MDNKKQPHVIMLRTAAVLLILVMLSTSMVAGRFARYTTSASGSDSARVARFSVTEAGEFLQTASVRIHPGETVPLAVQVKNDSEVAVTYSVTAENEYCNLPLEFVVLDGEKTVAHLAPGETKALAVQIGWQAEETEDKYIGMVDLIHLTVHVTQID